MATLKVPNSEATVEVSDEAQLDALLAAGFTKVGAKKSAEPKKK